MEIGTTNSKYELCPFFIKVATLGNVMLWGTPIIDGCKVKPRDIVLVKDQYDPKENGIYEVSYEKWERLEAFKESIPAGTVVQPIEGIMNKCVSFVFESAKVGIDDIIILPICFNTNIIPKDY